MGALQIPIGTYHRSQSGQEGSIVLNQATRDEFFNPKNEFIPVRLRSNKELMKARKVNPVYWIWEEDKIKRITVVSKGFYNKKKVNKLGTLIST